MTPPIHLPSDSRVPPSEEMIQDVIAAGGDTEIHKPEALPFHGDGHQHQWADFGHEVQCQICKWGFGYPIDGYVKEGHVYRGDGTLII